MASTTKHNGHLSYDSYWGIDEYTEISKPELLHYLKARGLMLKGSSERQDLVEIRQKVDRGKFCYEFDYVTIEDLKSFVHGRGLRLPIATTRKALVAVLNGPDECATFERFYELPVELRARVYAYYLGGFPRLLAFPTQPPLARASRLMRREVLPLFYRHVCPVLDFVYPSGTKDDKANRQLRPTAETSAFLESFPAEFDGNFQFVRFNISTSIRNGRLQPGMVMTTDCKVGYIMNDGTAAAKVLACEALKKPEAVAFEVALHSELSNTLQELYETSGRPLIRIAAVYVLRRAFERVFL